VCDCCRSPVRLAICRHFLSSDVVLMPLLALLSHDVAKCYGDQDGYGDSHPNAHPDDFFVDSTVISTFKRRKLCISICKLNITSLITLECEGQ
jgi:hypothetical protein